VGREEDDGKVAKLMVFPIEIEDRRPTARSSYGQPKTGGTRRI
jgi:hypothetical protein